MNIPENAGSGLIIAGVITLLIGLIIVIFKILSLPGYYVPVTVGIALIIVGATVRLLRK